MATALPVKLQLQITGNNIVSNDTYTKQYEVIAKSEKQFYNIKSTDGALPVSIEKLGEVVVITVDAPNAILQIITSTPETIEIPIAGKLFWEIPSTFAGIITNVNVRTDSTTNVNAEVSLWGVAPVVVS